MDHFRRIYNAHATEYHRMIAAEDVDGNLLPALRAVLPPHASRVLDLGTGTGRLPLLLRGEAAQMVGLDLHAAMLRENAAQRESVNGQWGLVQGDMGHLPFPTGWADVVAAGWAIGHLRGWYPDEWRAVIGQVLSEMHRVARPGGALVILETMTTGSDTPAPPTSALAEYYAWLESEWGFERQVLSTDYAFADVDDAVVRTEFFFGEELAAAIRQRQWARLPEWTGLWRKQVPASETPG